MKKKIREKSLNVSLMFMLGVLVLAPDIFAQSENILTVKGSVHDAFGESMIGVSVLVKETANGTITDMDGRYSVTVSDKNAVLVFSFVGHKSQEVKVGGKRVINIVLEENVSGLGEIVVVGYGTQKKVNLSGAVSQTDSKIFESRPIASMATALQGAIPGLNIAPATGSPNENIEFNIRGTTSINGGGPLVLVDGVEMSLKLVNPNDIESVSVLKDASASAIYGVRGAFGVVLITTKKGTTDKLTVTYSGNFSLAKPTIMPEFVKNSYDHAVFVNDGCARENVALMYDTDHLAAIKAYYENPNSSPYSIGSNGQYKYAGYMDWYKMVMNKTSPKQQHNINISGGSGNTRYYASLGHVREKGQIKINPDRYHRTNVRLNLENQAYDWLKISFKTLFNMSKMDEPHKYKDSFWHQIVFSSPTRPYRWFGDPAYPQYDQYIGMYFDDQNTVSLLDLGGRNKLKEQEILLSPSLDITPVKNWNIHIDFSYIKSNGNNTYHRKKVDMINARFLSTEGSTKDNSYEVFKSEKEYFSFNAYTDYTFVLKEKHHFKVMAGFNQELTKYTNTSGKRLDILLQNQPSLSLGSGEQTVKEDGYEWALRGGFARINYNYDNRYLFEINGRYDGTSRFPKNDRFVFLPSFSVAWRLSEEKFMQFARNLFDNIKFRASYGKLGNQHLSNNTLWRTNNKYYPYISFLTAGTNHNYLFDGKNTSATINPADLIPGSLTWEKSATINGGIDLTLLSSRLDVSFDIYRRTTSDMLILRDFPELLGAKPPSVNGGELQTNGWELSVNWKDKIGSDFSYEAGFSLFDSKAKITKYAGAPGIVTGYYEGKRIGEIWGYVTEGIFQTEEEVANHHDQSFINKGIWTPGDIKYKNLDGNNKINTGKNTPDEPGDRKVIGNETPRYNYGIMLKADYKGFFLSTFIQGVGKRDFWPSNQAFFPLGTQYYNTQKWHITDSWREDNRGAYLPIPRARNTKNNQVQTRFLQDGSYVRLKNFTLGYNLPMAWVRKVSLSKVQIYFSGENLWEHSKVKGPYDPESASKKGEMVYPFQRSYSIGVNMTF